MSDCNCDWGAGSGFHEPCPKHTMRSCNYPKPVGWYCTREEGHEGPCAAIKFNNANLKEGEPLNLESLECTMKVVRYDTEDGLLRYARWCARAAKVARFFRLWSWSDLFLRAEGHFLADAEHVRITLRSNRARWEKLSP